MFKAKSGKVAILFDGTLGALIEGTGAVPLADNSWFIIASVGSPTAFGDLIAGYPLRSPDNANAITPLAGDDVYPLAMNLICTTDTSMDPTTGTIDVTDKCSEGYNSMLSDGFTDIGGSSAGFLKFDDNGAFSAQTLKFYNKFFTVITDDGAGAYTFSPKNDTEIFMAILQNSDNTAVGDEQQWLMMPSILTGITQSKPLKGGQPFDLTFQKGQGPASLYTRTINAEEEASGGTF